MRDDTPSMFSSEGLIPIRENTIDDIVRNRSILSHLIAELTRNDRLDRDGQQKL